MKKARKKGKKLHNLKYESTCLVKPETKDTIYQKMDLDKLFSVVDTAITVLYERIDEFETNQQPLKIGRKK